MHGKSFVEILGTRTVNDCSVAYIIAWHISIQCNEWLQANVRDAENLTCNWGLSLKFSWRVFEISGGSSFYVIMWHTKHNECSPIPYLISSFNSISEHSWTSMWRDAFHVKYPSLLANVKGNWNWSTEPLLGWIKISSEILMFVRPCIVRTTM